MHIFDWRKPIRQFLIRSLISLRKKPKITSRKVGIFHADIKIPAWITILFAYSSLCYVFIMQKIDNFIYPQKFYEHVFIINLLLITLTFFTIYIIRKYLPKIAKSSNLIMLIGLSIIFSALITLIVSDSDVLPATITPLAAITMITNILLGPLCAIIISIINIIVFTILNSNNYDLFLILFFGQIAAILSTRNVNNRHDIARAGLYIALVHVILITALRFPKLSFSKYTLNMYLWVISNGLICSIITIGILPYLEGLFSITTNIKLLELADFNQPLLKEMMLKVPGTYNHSLMVGTLGEHAATAIGANPLLARVGAYYHDIGKMNKPSYYIENMPEQHSSKHEELTPNLSSLILLSHVKDGVIMAKKAKLDKTIIDIIEQHHGKSLIHFFYHKAIHESEEEVKEEKYRYPGPKPSSKEAVIIMLADSVEAASRTLEDVTPTKINDIVHKVINNKFVDGQLDECEIQLRDLHIISNSFTKTLLGIYHNRIDYAEDEDENEDTDL